MPVVTTPIGAEGMFVQSTDPISYGKLDMTKPFANE